MKNTNVLHLTLIAMMAVVMAICSWISIPLVIPFTLQTFGVFMTLLLLGGKLGSVSILIYILLGTVGVPVFAGFSGGLGVLLGPTGGYIVGFLASGLLFWAAQGLWKGKSEKAALILRNITLALCLLACYAFGTVWFVIVMASRGNQYSFIQALGMCVFPYLLPDLGKLVLANIVYLPLRRVLKTR